MRDSSRFSDILHLLSNARLIVMLLNAQGGITFVNEHGRNLCACPAADLVGRAFVDAMVEEGGRHRLSDRLTHQLRG
jgi:hypothetical protein